MRPFPLKLPSLLALVAGLFAAAVQAAAGPADYNPAEAPRLGLPVDCAGGDICVVQNYVDFDPGPAARDHTCGSLSYDGHKGIDIRLKTLEAMERGVEVLAAAPGTVIAVRDGVPDRLLNQTEARQALRGAARRERARPSNSVSLYHGNGWMTHYGHLRKGSIAVEPGQRVERGTRLGLIGASGSTSFPHLHFSLQLRERDIDPYGGREPGSGCGGAPYHSFWTTEAAALLAYRPSGLLEAGFVPERPSSARARKGHYGKAPLPVTARELGFWVRSWGLRKDDRLRMRLYAANGVLLAETTRQVVKDSPVSFDFLSIRRRTDAWPQGRYRGEFLLERPDATAGGTPDVILRSLHSTEVR